ncbi:unnamed protein product, partial [Iphiclides podalirius]
MQTAPKRTRWRSEYARGQHLPHAIGCSDQAKGAPSHWPPLRANNLAEDQVGGTTREVENALDAPLGVDGAIKALCRRTTGVGICIKIHPHAALIERVQSNEQVQA